MDTKYIRFVEGPPKPKTRTWIVVEDRAGGSIGTIAWMPQWRRYAFYPYYSTVYDAECLRVIVDFLRVQTENHKLGIVNHLLDLLTSVF